MATCPEDERRATEIAGALCPHCDEEVIPDDQQTCYADGTPIHTECFRRQIFGSAAHINRRCGCYVTGSVEHGPPGMTKREAARAAVLAYLARERRKGTQKGDHS